MAKGTDFGGVHSHRDLHLIQQKADVQPAQPKLNLIDIPGADGSKDLSTMPAGRVTFSDRELTWTFALYPSDDWHTKHRQVSGALNGKYCKITLDDDPDYYYLGRLVVSDYAVDRLLRQITVKAQCRPYKLRQAETTATRTFGTSFVTLLLTNDRKPVVPTITVTAETTLRWNGNDYVVAAGTHKILDIELQEGVNNLEAKVASGTGDITVIYQKGAL